VVWDLFITIFSKPRGPSAKSPGAQGLWVNLQQAQRISCKIARIFQILEFFFNGKTGGPGPRCDGPVARSGPQWTEQAAWTRARRRIIGARHAGPLKLTGKARG
jgi:hypothetical protein